MSDQTIYLDHAATTPMDERVLEAMMPYLTSEFGNAASRQHAMGRQAAAAVEQARAQVALLIGADPREIVFTSGATEANNLALKGVAHAKAYELGAKRFVSARSEHHAVLDPLRALEEKHGYTVTRLPVDSEGRLDLADLDQSLALKPKLVSLMHVNNELGTIHPLQDIGRLCREQGVLFHTDASQSVGKLPIDVNSMYVDLLSLSGHKFYGPKGVGALFLRRRGPRVRCEALLDGGGHEGGRRSGTINVAGVVGLGAAAELCVQDMDQEVQRIGSLSANFENALRARLSGVGRNGPSEGRLPHILNLSFEGVSAESLLSRFKQVCASSSSACTSAQLQESHVLRAIGMQESGISSSLRFSFGRSTSENHIQRALDEIVDAVTLERADGPLNLCQP
ncbi:MAG: cysteine desulfurase [Candidatus Paceibacteria bacterium]|jgi:cysteine desulfurase